MEVTWEDIEANKESKGSFIKLKNNESIEGVFVGQPYKFFSSFKTKEHFNQWAEGRATRYRVNFVTNDGLGWTAKIYETGTTTIRLIAEQVKEYGKDCIFKIKRTGSSKDDTVYHVMFKAKLGEKEIEAIKNVKPNELGIKSKKEETYDEVPAPSDQDIPF